MWSGLIIALLIFELFASPAPVVAQERNRTIRSISFEILQIFDKPKNSFYETVNSLKLDTQESVLRKELLFREGDDYEQFLVLESERVLRQLRYLRDVSIQEVVDGEFVDIIIHGQETWTIIPQVSYSSGDGRTKQSVGLAESNLLGYGKRLELLYKQEEESDAVQAVYDSRNFFETKNQFLAGFFDGSEGTEGLIEIGNPYRSLVQESSWGITLDGGDTLERLWHSGDERFIYGKEHLLFDVAFSRSFGNPEDTTHRLSFGYEYEDSRFRLGDAGDIADLDIDPSTLTQDPSLVADNRRFSGPWLGFESIEQDFVSMNYIDRFSRVEDYNLGQTYATKVFFAPEALGSREDALLLHTGYSIGSRISSGTFVRGELAVTSRLVDSGFEDSLFHLETKAYSVLGPLFWKDFYLGKHTLAFNFFVDYGNELDKDRELIVGAQNVLRGYKANTFSGDKRFGASFEDRIHLMENAFDLISIGAAAFADVGGATFRPIDELFQDELYADVGVGLRFAFPRSSGERVVRVDFAFPLRDGPDDSGRFELRVIFSGGQLFGSRLRTERQAAQRASVDIGF